MYLFSFCWVFPFNLELKTELPTKDLMIFYQIRENEYHNNETIIKIIIIQSNWQKQINIISTKLRSIKEKHNEIKPNYFKFFKGHEVSSYVEYE